MAARNKPNEIYITRVYDAPVSVVWDAWTDPKQVAQWWGPRGFTLTTHAKDFRPGGFWKYTMHGPDGTDWENKTIYHEIEKHALLVYDHGGGEDRPPLFRVTVRFTETKGKTKMEMTMALATPEAARETKKFIKKAGGDSTWDRLAEYLDKGKTGEEKFFINRVFEATPEKMYEMWTNPEHVRRWLPPTGFEMEYIRADIRPGGRSFYVMSNDSGMKMYGRSEYVEMKKPERLVYTQQFCDEQEKVSRHPLAPTWPETMLSIVTFSEEEPGHTRVTVEWSVQGHATPEEIAAFVKEKPGMTLGWTGSFDKLESYLGVGN